MGKDYHGKCHCGDVEWTVNLEDDKANHVLW